MIQIFLGDALSYNVLNYSINFNESYFLSYFPVFIYNFIDLFVAYKNKDSIMISNFQCLLDLIYICSTILIKNVVGDKRYV